MHRRWKILIIFGSLSFLADQITKYWARAALLDGDKRTPITVIQNYFDFELSYNPGSAFGMFGSTSGARVFLTVVGIIAIGMILWMLYKAREDQQRLAVALALIIGGAIGNLYDRILFGEVTDFIVWRINEHRWPTFNIADAVLCVGVGLLFLDMTKEAKLAKEAEEAEAAAAAAANKKPGAPKKKKKKR